MPLYHYTKGIHVPKIVASGEIRPSKQGFPKDERAIVWLSSNPVWEATVSPIWGKEKMERLGCGLYRFVVDIEAAYTWERLRFLSKIHPALADGLEKSARDVGANPDEWFGTFRPVTSDKWAAIEVWKGERWVSSDYTYKRTA